MPQLNELAYSTEKRSQSEAIKIKIKTNFINLCTVRNDVFYAKTKCVCRRCLSGFRR